MAHHNPPPRLTYRLVSPQALRWQMKYRRMTIRELSVACGNPSYKSTIGNLTAGIRDTCSAHMAVRIEEALVCPGLLFVPVMRKNQMDIAQPAQARGGRAA